MSDSPAEHTPTPEPAAPGIDYPDSYWRSLLYFNGYRLAVATVLLLATAVLGQTLLFGSWNRPLFVTGCVGYVVYSALSFATIAARRPSFPIQLVIQVGGDILFIVLLLHASGGISSGLGLLLLANLAAAGIISRGRLTLFFASLASVAVLLEHTYEVLFFYGSYTMYLQAGLLSIGYFATAWLAHALAKRATASEQLAAQREVDLASMAQVSQLVMQDMQDGVIVVDSRGVVRQMNARAEELLGPAPKVRDLHLKEYNSGLAARLARWQENPDAGFDPLRTILTQKVTAARFVPVGSRESQGVVIFIEDLTRIQTQAQQMKLVSLGRLTANIAHEIRNPLSAINHAAELLQEEQGTNETQRRLLQIIHDNAQRLDRMVQDVLRLNRRDRAVRETFSLGEFLRNFAAQFCEIEKVAPELIRVNMSVQPRVSFDRSHLNQVMWNLCRNALRYSKRQEGSVQIAVEPGAAHGTVELSVIDDGPGVAESLRAHLFEPFFTTASSGTGLGLYIAREVCEANGANLSYVERPAGAQFMVVIKSV
ncbi:MAG: HAMP domain-containing histidine kinase [Betaproteobacteria bacterium]|nr:HAMP domain-containing histidine kinase [Betaproteobacteria bacterium]MBL8534277.1 HAMP domain-containing histidine kinase [Betaproteobacteria bacterium]